MKYAKYFILVAIITAVVFNFSTSTAKAQSVNTCDSQVISVLTVIFKLLGMNEQQIEATINILCPASLPSATAPKITSLPIATVSAFPLSGPTSIQAIFKMKVSPVGGTLLQPSSSDFTVKISSEAGDTYKAQSVNVSQIPVNLNIAEGTEAEITVTTRADSNQLTAGKKYRFSIQSITWQYQGKSAITQTTGLNSFVSDWVDLSTPASTSTPASRDTQRRADLQQLNTALQTFWYQRKYYPSADGWISSVDFPNENDSLAEALLPAKVIASIPVDPQATGPGGNGGYVYYRDDYCGGTAQTYSLYAKLENPTVEDTATMNSTSIKCNDQAKKDGMNYRVGTVVATPPSPTPVASITFISPKVGEKWIVGNTYNVEWKSDQNIYSYKVEICQSDKCTSAGGGSSSTGSIIGGKHKFSVASDSFLVPSTVSDGTAAKIKFTDTKSGKIYYSEGFEILQSIAAPKIAPLPTLTVSNSPLSGPTSIQAIFKMKAKAQGSTLLQSVSSDFVVEITGESGDSYTAQSVTVSQIPQSNLANGQEGEITVTAGSNSNQLPSGKKYRISIKSVTWRYYEQGTIITQKGDLESFISNWVNLSTPASTFTPAQRDVQRKQDIALIQQALESYRQAKGRYPESSGATNGPNNAWFNSTDNSWSTLATALKPYASTLPQDPMNSAGWSGYGNSKISYNYSYYSNSYSNDNGNCYVLMYRLENPDIKSPGVYMMDGYFNPNPNDGVITIGASCSKARDAQRKSDLVKLKIAIEEYRVLKGAYPSTDGWISSVDFPNENDSLVETLVPAGVIKEIPIDPALLGTESKGNGGYVYMRDDYCGGNRRTYSLYAKLENPTRQDLNTMNPASAYNRYIKCNTFSSPTESGVKAAGMNYRIGTVNVGAVNTSDWLKAFTDLNKWFGSNVKRIAEEAW